MTRRIALSSALTLAVVAATAYAYQKPPRTTKEGTNPSKADLAQARSQFYAAQAALFSALADAEALDKILDLSNDPDLDLARSLISTINRSIQTTASSTVKMGQVIHSIEREESLKAARSELDQAFKAVDDAHAAADGYGPINPHAKNMEAHLLNAMVALGKLAAAVDVEPLRRPATRALTEARAEQKKESSPVERIERRDRR